MRPAHLPKAEFEDRLVAVAGASSDPPQRSSVARPLPVGARARRLQRRLLLRDRSLEGLYWLFDQYVGRPLVNLYRIAAMIRLVGGAVRREFGVSIRRQAWDQARLIMFHGAKAWMYYVLEFYREGAMANVGAVIMRNEVKHGLFKGLNRIDPEARDRARKLGDKLEVSRWCNENQIPHPHPIMLVEGGKTSWLGCRADLDRDLFVKRRHGRGAFNAASYWRTGPFEYRDEEGRQVALDEVIDEVQRRSQRSKRDRLMVMPLLHNHPALADLADVTLITFRLITCLDEELRPVLTNAYLRSMTKLEPSWDVGLIEEYGAPIDPETGALGRITGDKPPCLSEWFDHHPVTGAAVTGRIVPCWPELAALALRAHRLVPERVIVGWDMAITPDGPALLEGNSFLDPIFPQRVFRQPIGEMRLGELLDFHLDRLEVKLDQAGWRFP
ncbi:MAG TPA: sugar-transfer associated ATP-grasp domain-containing protein [Dongiaceae bacterium]|nr:sugar-transfer associated ATP-grasp domain-containing protein [Dongiaceae bacterium]